MAKLKVPVRWYSGTGYYEGKAEEKGDGHAYADLELELERTAFMVVDSDCGPGNKYVEQGIAPALRAARAVGMHVIYIHNDFSLADEPGSIKREIHGTRWGDARAADRPPPSRAPHKPNYSPSIQPLAHEPDFPKREWSGFHETHTDYHLRCYDIKTLIATGFSQRACLYQTLAGAVEHNYRVILLRDCTFSSEYPDTLAPELPEGGWLRKIMFRNFEHVIGYTSTSAEFAAACQASAKK
ncbi:MAG: cysteine hydrolase [Candidatus Latescibacteria bacterium]|nr:cysteine hydrolase [Candidatus Latescibacterota bacterium]